MATISGWPPRLFRNRQESCKTESATCSGLAEEGCGGVVLSTLDSNLPCHQDAAFTDGHISKNFCPQFSEDNRFACRLGKREGTRTIEYRPQELGRYGTSC
jgi:hypothetical protein